MPQRVFCFVVVLIFFFNGEIFSQGKPVLLKLPIKYYTPAYYYSEKQVQLNYNSNDTIKFTRTKKYDSPGLVNSRQPVILSGPILSPSYYTTQIGFFCKKELQLEKITALPIRVRLGSLAYVNYLEQKPGAVKP
jgi:hypothetical protein